jgi:hypothetical protein
MTSFEGVTYRTAENWYSFIPNDGKPLRYLEIGAFYGANLLSVERTYARNPDSHVSVIDPWIDYDQYPEYKGQQSGIYSTFLKNTEHIRDKLTIHRGFSHEILPTLDDGSYDIIYIDGNHEPEFVLEDAVLAFRKVKVGGHIIFDDYGWGGPDLTKRGIDAFLHGYHKRIRILGEKESQVFVKKLN